MQTIDPKRQIELEALYFDARAKGTAARAQIQHHAVGTLVLQRGEEVVIVPVDSQFQVRISVRMNPVAALNMAFDVLEHIKRTFPELQLGDLPARPQAPRH
jgi:hypothetical protein